VAVLVQAGHQQRNDRHNALSICGSSSSSTVIGRRSTWPCTSTTVGQDGEQFQCKCEGEEGPQLTGKCTLTTHCYCLCCQVCGIGQPVLTLLTSALPAGLQEAAAHVTDNACGCVHSIRC
jgi:hypothetical protein